MLLAARPSFRAWLRRRVVLVLVARPAHIILPLVHLLAFLRSQRAAIGRAIRPHLVVDAGLTAFHVARLARRHLPGAHALRNPLLLVIGAHADPGHRHVPRMAAVR